MKPNKMAYAVDPYSEAVSDIVQVLHLAQKYNGAMSESEYETLASVAVSLEARDPHIGSGIPKEMKLNDV